MSVVVPLPLASPAILPAAFVARWRELELFHGLRAHVLEADEVLDAGSAGWWFLVRVAGRIVSSTCCASPAEAATKTFALWRLATSQRKMRRKTFQWQDTGEGVRRLVEVTS